MSDESYISVNDLAKRWAVTPQIVRRMIKSGELPAFRFRNLQWRIKMSAVLEYEQVDRDIFVTHHDLTTRDDEPW